MTETAFERKINKFREILSEPDIDSVVINDQINFSYITGGRGYININGGGSIAPLVITRDKVFLIANNIEAMRLAKEEIQGDVDIKTYPWYDSAGKDELIKRLAGKFIYDTQVPEKTACIRYAIDEGDIAFYKEMTKDTAHAVEDACKSIKPGMSEWEIASVMCKNCIKMGIEPSVHLVGTDERAVLYRHPLPTGRKLSKLAILSVNGMKNGMWASATRMVYFGKPSDELIRRHRAVLNVDACFILNTRVGSIVGDIFNKAAAEYQKQGFKNEWTHHHQGGLTGYNSREFRAYGSTKIEVEKNQAYAWNPTIKGTKSEDTILTTDADPEILTYTGDYEYTRISYEGHSVMRPDILIR